MHNPNTSIPLPVPRGPNSGPCSLAVQITFPSVWTNTCCSHPISGCDPSEVDEDADIARGTVPGAKRAAIRKLEHELGIPAGSIPASAFKYLTRIHYAARDTRTHGEDSPWGEHEVDYILLARVPRGQIQMTPNPEEVDDVKYVQPLPVWL